MHEWIQRIVGQRQVTPEEFKALEQYYNKVREVSASLVSHAFTSHIKTHGIERWVLQDARLDN